MNAGLELEIGATKRNTLVNSKGIKYLDFKGTLTPKYYLVWLHLLLGYLALVVIAVAIVGLHTYRPELFPLSVLLGGVLLGYVIAHNQLFLHEATHYNLTKSRKLNDLLANLFIGSLTGQNVRTYRVVHFQHHRKLGAPEDTENSYFDPLNVRYVIESLFGIRPLKVLYGRMKFTKSQRSKKAEGLAHQEYLTGQLLVGLLLNGVIVVGALVLNYLPLALAWTLGVLVFFPFFGAVRQLLEHRGDHASKATDYHQVPHGKVNRLFGDGPVASTLGGAGFNRHLLHHWEPQISYTRLHDLETYLKDTEFAAIIDKSQSTYFQTFLHLFGR